MFLITYFKEIILSISALVGLYLLKRNKTLTTENQSLNLETKEKEKVINVQNKVLEASSNITHSDLDANLERLSGKNK